MKSNSQLAGQWQTAQKCSESSSSLWEAFLPHLSLLEEQLDLGVQLKDSPVIMQPVHVGRI